MKREFLKNLELSDEAIDKIMAEHGNTLNTTKKENETLKNELVSKADELKASVKALDHIKKNYKDDETVKQLLAEKDEEVKKAQEALTTTKNNTLLDNALKSAKVRNTKAFKALLDNDLIKFENGEVKGLEEQITKLKESDDYLFEVEKTEETTPTINREVGGERKTADPVTTAFAKEFGW